MRGQRLGVFAKSLAVRRNTASCDASLRSRQSTQRRVDRDSFNSSEPLESRMHQASIVAMFEQANDVSTEGFRGDRMSTAQSGTTLPKPNADFYQISDCLSPADRERMKRVREFMESKVAPIINKF